MIYLWKIYKCSFHGSDPKSRRVSWLADCFQFSFVDKWDDENDSIRKKLHPIQFSVGDIFCLIK